MESLIKMVNSSSILTVVMVGVSVLLSIAYLRRRDSRYPPGPYSLPILGNLPQIILSGSIVKFCEKYQKRFGNVFSLEIGGAKRVVVCGYEAMHELLIKNADYTSTRAANVAINPDPENAQHNSGLLFAAFPHWKTIRYFALLMLRDGGMGKAVLEPQITDEVELYIQHYVEPHLGEPINMYTTLPKGTSNIISHLLFGRRFEYTDHEFSGIISAINRAFRLSTQCIAFSNIPFISYLGIDPLAQRKALFVQVIRPFFQKCIEDHKQNLDADNLHSLIDHFLLSGEQEECFSEENVGALCRQLYLAGMETTSTALRWALLYMCFYPEIMEKVQEEIDQQIGQRPISYKDHLNMPYTDAVLLETLRIGNIVSTALPHTVEKDMYICGQLIPAGADVLLNMSSALNDEEVFEEPTKFKPERYLTGDVALKKRRTIPFGFGRRACLGESLAKVELFLFFVNFLQKYKVQLPAGSKVTSEPVASIVNSPVPYDIMFTARK